MRRLRSNDNSGQQDDKRQHRVVISRLTPATTEGIGRGITTEYGGTAIAQLSRNHFRLVGGMLACSLCSNAISQRITVPFRQVRATSLGLQLWPKSPVARMVCILESMPPKLCIHAPRIALFAPSRAGLAKVVATPPAPCRPQYKNCLSIVGAMWKWVVIGPHEQQKKC